MTSAFTGVLISTINDGLSFITSISRLLVEEMFRCFPGILEQDGIRVTFEELRRKSNFKSPMSDDIEEVLFLIYTKVDETAANSAANLLCMVTIVLDIRCS